MSENDLKTGMKKDRRRLHVLIITLFFFACFFLSYYQRHVEFIGDDDFRSVQRIARYGMYDLVPDQFSLSGLLEWGRINFQILFNEFHGPCPGLYIGPLFRLFDLTGIPISSTSLHFPMALLSALTVCLVYILLIREGFSTSLSFLGTLIFLISPVFSQASRTTCYPYIVTIPLNQALILLALQKFRMDKKHQLLAGAALLHILLSDTIFMLTIPAVVAAFALREMPGLSTFHSFRSFFSYLKLKAGPLLTWRIWFIPAVIVLLMVVFTVLTFAGEVPGQWERKYGYYTTQLYRILADHLSPGNTEPAVAYFSLTRLVSYWVLLLGEAFPFILPFALLAGIQIIRKRKATGVVWSFTLIAGAGYGIMWYLLFGYEIGVPYAYQIYLLLPFLLLVLFAARIIIREKARLKPLVFLILAILLISATMSNLHWIWRKVPLFYTPSALINYRMHGVARDNLGTKGIGFLVREVINRQLGKGEHETVRVWIVRNYSNSVRAFSGLIDDGRRIRDEYGVKAEIQDVKNVEELERYLPDDIANTIECTSPECVVIDFRGRDRSTRFSKYDVISESGDKILGSVFVFPAIDDSTFYLQSSVYRTDCLEALFDARYYRLKDFFYEF